jgi:hypothetical protein
MARLTIVGCAALQTSRKLISDRGELLTRR